MKSTSLSLIIGLAFALAGLLPLSGSYAGEVPRYRLQDLGVLPGAVLSAAQRINNRGEVAGFLEDAEDKQVPFLFRGGRMISLGLPPGPYTDGFVTDMNQRGEVVGINRGETDFDAGFLYTRGRLIGLSNVFQYPIVLTALGLNNHGVMVGNARFEEEGAAFAFVFMKGAAMILPSLIPGGYCLAFDVNDAGSIIGTAQSSFPDRDGWFDSHAVIYSHGRITDLGVLPGGNNSFGTRINERGHAIGVAQTGTASHAFLYRRGRMIDLGTLPGDSYSEANGLNHRDQVVGRSSGESSGFRAVLFMHGGVYDLNTLLTAPTDLVLEQATDINDWGAITGVARLGAHTRAVLLTPEGPIF